MKLINILLSEVSIPDLKKQWVDSGKLDEYEFRYLTTCAGEKSAYATWIVKRYSELGKSFVGQLTIREWQSLFAQIEKNGKAAGVGDINRYKSEEDFRELRRKLAEYLQNQQTKSVDRCKIGKVSVEGKTYEVFLLPHGKIENKDVAIQLGKTGPENKGWCTSYDSDDRTFWEKHITGTVFGDMYIFRNPADKANDKYQLQEGYADGRLFPIQTDSPLSWEESIKFLPFYQFISKFSGEFSATVEKLKLLMILKETPGLPIGSFKVAEDMYLFPPDVPAEKYVKTIIKDLFRSETYNRVEHVYSTVEYFNRLFKLGYSILIIPDKYSTLVVKVKDKMSGIVTLSEYSTITARDLQTGGSIADSLYKRMISYFKNAGIKVPIHLLGIRPLQYKDLSKFLVQGEESDLSICLLDNKTSKSEDFYTRLVYNVGVEYGKEDEDTGSFVQDILSRVKGRTCLVYDSVECLYMILNVDVPKSGEYSDPQDQIFGVASRFGRPLYPDVVEIVKVFKTLKNKRGIVLPGYVEKGMNQKSLMKEYREVSRVDGEDVEYFKIPAEDVSIIPYLTPKDLSRKFNFLLYFVQRGGRISGILTDDSHYLRFRRGQKEVNPGATAYSYREAILIKHLCEKHNIEVPKNVAEFLKTE